MLPIASFAIDNALAVEGQGVGFVGKLYMLISGARKRETLAFAKEGRQNPSLLRKRILSRSMYRSGYTSDLR
jgi:hypothetical protein